MIGNTIKWIIDTALLLLSFFVAVWMAAIAITHAGYTVVETNPAVLAAVVSVLIALVYTCLKRTGTWLLLLISLGASL